MQGLLLETLVTELIEDRKRRAASYYRAASVRRRRRRAPRSWLTSGLLLRHPRAG